MYKCTYIFILSFSRTFCPFIHNYEPLLLPFNVSQKMFSLVWTHVGNSWVLFPFTLSDAAPHTVVWTHCRLLPLLVFCRAEHRGKELCMCHSVPVQVRLQGALQNGLAESEGDSPAPKLRLILLRSSVPLRNFVSFVSLGLRKGIKASY